MNKDIKVCIHTWHYLLLLSNTRTRHHSLHQRYTDSGPVPILALESRMV